MTAFTANKSLTKPANGDDVDTWDVPVNANSDIIDAAFGGTTTLNVTGASGTVILTSTQYRPPFMVVSGTLTASVIYQVPSGVGGEWSVSNITTGAFTVTISSGGGGTSVVLPQGSRTVVQSDGTNIVTGPAASGVNADITQLKGLTTPLTVPQGGSGAATLTGVLKGNGTSAFTAATAGSDYVAPGTATAFTGTQTFSGTTSALAEILTNAAEITTVSATAATGTIAYYLSSQSLIFFTTAAAANWITNLTFAIGHTLDSVMSTGQTVTATFAVTQGSPAFYNTTVQIDGTTSGVTTKWLGGAPTSGNASGVDIYTYAIVKTGSAAFTVFATQTAWT